MALIRKRYSSFGREERPSGIRALIKADTLVIRAIAFALCAMIFLLIVQITHKNSPAETANIDSVAVTPKK